MGKKLNLLKNMNLLTVKKMSLLTLG